MKVFKLHMYLLIPGAHQGTLLLPSLAGRGEKKHNKRLMGQDKSENREEITQQLLSWEKQPWLEKTNLLKIKSKTIINKMKP